MPTSVNCLNAIKTLNYLTSKFRSTEDLFVCFPSLTHTDESDELTFPIFENY